MSRKNLIKGALALVLGGAFLFFLADISGTHHSRPEMDDMPQETANPRPYVKNGYIVSLPAERLFGGFLVLQTKWGIPPLPFGAHKC